MAEKEAGVPNQETNVFIAWSGDASKKVAALLSHFLQRIDTHIRPWFSSENLAPGTLWRWVLQNELAKPRVGVLCLTPDNLQSAWIHFEAGVLSKGVGESNVCPYLLNVSKSSFKGPLSDLQAAEADEAGTWSLVEMVSRETGSPAKEMILRENFASVWPELSKGLHGIKPTNPPPTPKPEETIGEILGSGCVRSSEVCHPHSTRTS
jgi:hypothetical protein